MLQHRYEIVLTSLLFQHWPHIDDAQSEIIYVSVCLFVCYHYLYAKAYYGQENWASTVNSNMATSSCFLVFLTQDMLSPPETSFYQVKVK